MVRGLDCDSGDANQSLVPAPSYSIDFDGNTAEASSQLVSKQTLSVERIEQQHLYEPEVKNCFLRQETADEHAISPADSLCTLKSESHRKRSWVSRAKCATAEWLHPNWMPPIPEMSGGNKMLAAGQCATSAPFLDATATKITAEEDHSIVGNEPEPSCLVQWLAPPTCGCTDEGAAGVPSLVWRPVEPTATQRSDLDCPKALEGGHQSVSRHPDQLEERECRRGCHEASAAHLCIADSSMTAGAPLFQSSSSSSSSSLLAGDHSPRARGPLLAVADCQGPSVKAPPGTHLGHPGVCAASALRDPWLNFARSRISNLADVSFLTEEDLQGIFLSAVSKTDFSWYPNQSILDFRLDGVSDAQVLHTHFPELNPIIVAMMALAERTLQMGEELAVIRVVVTVSKYGGDELKRQRHHCKQICVALGGGRIVEVWPGERFRLDSGDALYLGGETTFSMPVDSDLCVPRASVCLFYGSKEEWRRGELSTDDARTEGLCDAGPDDWRKFERAHRPWSNMAEYVRHCGVGSPAGSVWQQQPRARQVWPIGTSIPRLEEPDSSRTLSPALFGR